MAAQRKPMGLAEVGRNETMGQLYFHSPCFDGIASAVLSWEFLEVSEGWTSCELISVNYSLRASWTSNTLRHPAAIVDFLYHPEAVFWADHHVSTFVDHRAREHFERSRPGLRFYDPGARACARLLWDALRGVFLHRQYEELVHWAEKIDSANYQSVEEALFSDAPAMRIQAALAVAGGEAFSAQLVRALRKASLEDVARDPQVVSRAQRAREALRRGLDRFRSRMTEDRIAVFDIVGDEDAIISRYAPYYFHPEARYSAGIVRQAHGAKVTVMRNPWMDFESVSLGNICERYGGGGHQRVGSIQLLGSRAAEAQCLLSHVLRDIRAGESLRHISRIL